jgi:hypothetical protein
MAPKSIQPVTEMSTRDLPGVKVRPVREADNLPAICEPIVELMWDPGHLATLYANSSYYGDGFPFSLCNVAMRWHFMQYAVSGLP